MSLSWESSKKGIVEFLGKIDQIIVKPVVSAIRWVLVIEPIPLFKVRLFWLATLVPPLLAFYFAAPLSEGLSFKRSKVAYENFVKVFEFPLWVASGSILFGVMVGRFHGSVQRHEAIRQAEENNSFSNYMDHRELFGREFVSGKGNVVFRVIIKSDLNKSFKEVCTIIIDADTLYRFLFPHNSHAKFNTSIAQITDFPVILKACQSVYGNYAYDRELTNSFDQFMTDNLATTCFNEVDQVRDEEFSLARNMALFEYILANVEFMAKDNDKNKELLKNFRDTSKREAMYIVKSYTLTVD